MHRTLLELPDKLERAPLYQHGRLEPDSAAPYGWMLSAVLAFTIMAALAHALGSSCDWQIIATARTGLAFVLSLALALASGARLVFLRPRTMWIRSISGSISLMCTFYALTHLPIADVLTVTNFFPIWVALLSWPVLHEKPTGQAWIAIVVAITGVFLVQQPHFATGEGKLPILLALVASMATAVSMLGLHRLHQIDPRAIVAHFSGVALVFCLASLFLIPNTALADSHFDGRTLAMLLGVGVCATVGQIFLTKAFAAGPPAKVSVVALSQVGLAMIFDIMLGHAFTAITILGMALVMAPTAWLLVSQGRAQVEDL